MTIQDYIQQNLPFFHISSQKNRDSFLANGLRPGVNGICVIRSDNRKIWNEIGLAQIKTLYADPGPLMVIKILPKKHGITPSMVCEDTIAERTSPLHNYIVRSSIPIEKEDIIEPEFIPTNDFIDDVSEIVALTGYTRPGRPSQELQLVF